MSNHFSYKHVFFSRSKFNLNDIVLNDSECMKYSISLSTKLIKVIDEFLKLNIDIDSNKSIFEIIESNKLLENNLRKLIDNQQNELNCLESQIQSETIAVKKDDLANRYATKKNEKRVNEFRLKEFSDKETFYYGNFRQGLCSLRNGLYSLSNQSEFIELKKLRLNMQISTFNNITSLLSNFKEGALDTSSNGTSLDFAFYYGILSPYLKKLTFIDSSNDANNILILILSIYFIKMKQSFSEMNRFRLTVLNMDENLNLQAYMNDSDAVILVFYDDTCSTNPFSVLAIDRETKLDVIQIYYHTNQNSDKLETLIINLKKRYENEFNFEIKKIDLNYYNLNLVNENIYTVASIIRQIFTNDYTFDECLSIDLNQFNENLNYLVKDLVKSLKIYSNQTNYSDVCLFLSLYEKLEANLKQEVTNNELHSLYKTIKQLQTSLSLLKGALTEDHKSLFNKFSFDSISECTVALSKLSSLEKSSRYKNCELFLFLKNKLQEELDASSNSKTTKLLNDFVTKMRSFIALMASYFMQHGELNFKQSYEYNYTLIKSLDTFIHDIIDSFSFKEDNKKLVIYHKYPNEYFQDMQLKFEDTCDNMGIPREIFDEIKFSNFFVDIGNQILCAKSDIVESKVNATKEREQENKTRGEINSLIDVLHSKLKEANVLDPPPQELIVRLKKLLHALKDIDETKVTQKFLNDTNSEVRQVLYEIDEYKRRIESFDYFSLLLPNINIKLDIPSITIDDFKSNQNYQNQSSEVFENLKKKLNDLKLIRQDKESGDKIKNNCIPYKTLLRMNAKLLLWKDVLNKLSNSIGKVPIENLLGDVDMLSDELNIKLRSTLKDSQNDEAKLKEVVTTLYKNYALFRMKLLEENSSFFNNYEYVEEICKSPSNILKCESRISLTNLFDVFTHFSRLSASIKYELKSYPIPTSFTLLPFYVEYVDLVSSILPEQHGVIEYLLNVENNLINYGPGIL